MEKNREVERFRIYFEEQVMRLSDELDVGSELTTNTKIGSLSFDLCNRANDLIMLPRGGRGTVRWGSGLFSREFCLPVKDLRYLLNIDIWSVIGC